MSLSTSSGSASSSVRGGNAAASRDAVETRRQRSGAKRPESALFRALHARGCFVIPNPWDVGSARYLQHVGFPALATTSAGFAFSQGMPDSSDAAVMTRQRVLDHIASIAAAVDVPVSADFMSGYGVQPDDVAESVARCLATGVAGISIEDATGDPSSPLFDLSVATERVRAARRAIDQSGDDVLLTARAECFLVGHPDPLRESVRRLQAYAAAGADVLFAPGPQHPAEIQALVHAVAPKPLSLLVAHDIGLDVAEIAALGVRRISVGPAFALAAWTGFMRAAQTLRRKARSRDCQTLSRTPISTVCLTAISPAMRRQPRGGWLMPRDATREDSDEGVPMLKEASGPSGAPITHANAFTSRDVKRNEQPRKGTEIMKLVIIGGTGLIGSKVVTMLREHGHDAIPASPGTGVNTLTGEGLANAMQGAAVVVDVSNSPSFEEKAVLDFFTTSTRNLLEYATAAGVKHYVVLSVVGTERIPDSPYLRAKSAQEALIKAGGIPYSIVHATQFFEFFSRIADEATDGSTVRLPPVLIQPMAADDVAKAVGRVAVGTPVNGTVEVAGPQLFGFDEFIRQGLAARNDRREVVVDKHARYFGAELSERSLIPADNNARLSELRFQEWLNPSGSTDHAR